MPQTNFRFEVAFSFAGPHREKVRSIAELVSARIDPGLADRSQGRVFFDEWFEHEILGPNMRLHLQRIYFQQSRMVLADISDEYAGRQWCQAELEAIDALLMSIDSARDETARLRVVYCKFGDGRLRDVLPNTGYIDTTTKTAEECIELIYRRQSALIARMVHEPAAAPLAVVSAKPAPPIRFFHPATNDDRYSRRESELKWLDDCAKDKTIRIATVTGQGGLGKTSLVGHWIEKQQGWRHRSFRGVFFYSFYSNRNPRDFFAALLSFVCEVEKIPSLPKDTPLHHLAAQACRRWSYLVVLDGLEVLQHGEDDPTHYGWINDGELTEFVARVGEQGNSLLVLTSRFPFPKITDEYPCNARANELPLLDAHAGADLLRACGLTESRDRLAAYGNQLGGHPLALRLFAGLCLEQPLTEPDEVIAAVRSPKEVESMPDPDGQDLEAEERQKHRQRRQFYKLLRWFQQKLTPPKRRLLQLVSLFRDPVPTATLVALAKGMKSMRMDFARCDAARLTGLLEQLSDQSLLQKESVGESVHWTAHPIVRDVFRAEALAAGDTLAQQFADIVAGKGDGGRPRTVSEVLPIIESIEVLLAARDFKAANDLYRGRLENGYIFQYIPAPQEGLRCARAFLEPAPRRAELEKTLGRGSLAAYLNALALFASIVGEMDEAVRGYARAITVSHGETVWNNVCACLQNIADVQILSGSLWDAVASTNEAMFYAGVAESTKRDHANLFVPLAPVLGEEGLGVKGSSRYLFPPRPATAPEYDENEEGNTRVFRAHALSLAGQLAAASLDFAAADAMTRKDDPDNDTLYSILGYHWSRHRYRLGETATTRRLTEANRILCEKNGWNGTQALCDLLLGELDLAAGDYSSAAPRIAAALSVFRNAKQDRDLPDALLAQSRGSLRDPTLERGAIHDNPFVDDESALSLCDEALRLSARIGFQLKKCDALNLRALLLRATGRLDEALADSTAARELAERCHYYWGHHESLRQLRDTHQSLGHVAVARDWSAAEQALTAKMAPEFAAALEINRQHDAEMEKLYGKK